jgi:broad specificity phosphatase PhoE
MKRCRETLALLHPGVPHELNAELREIDFGRWEGLSFPEISKSDPDLIDLWRTTGDSFCFPDGECIKTFNRRVEEFSSRLLAAVEKRILIIAHGGTIRHLLTLFLGLDPEQSGIFTIQPGCFSTVALYGELGTLTALNVSGKHK